MTIRNRPVLAFLSTAALLAAMGQPAAAQRRPPQHASVPSGQQAPLQGSESILAIVNGDVISRSDVDNRGRLFGLSTGLNVTPDTLVRLRPQILKQLIDERLRLQEVQRRKIVVSDKEIADAIAEIEQRNGMPNGLLRAKLQADGVGYRTLIDQIRVQIGWGRVVRQELGSRAQVSDADVADRVRIQKEQTGQTEYRLSEIFVPIDDPTKAPEAQKFADTVIGQLRAGAPFPVVAAQFSQSQTALQGGDEGWMRPNQLDPEVAGVVAQMPVGAVSNPVRVAGGISIVSLRDKRALGQDVATVLHLRQVFLPFQGQLNPNAPTEQQRRTVEQAGTLAKTARDCDAMDAAAKAANSPRPADPGEIRLDGMAPGPLRQLISSLQPNQPSRPIVSMEGVAIVMVCSKEQKTLSEPTKEEAGNQVLQQRIELTSRQLVRDLRRRAILDERA